MLSFNSRASYASVMTILSFSLERYLVICTPLYIFPMSDIRRACLVSLVCWITALAASVPHLLFTKINYIDDPHSAHTSDQPLPQSAFCAMMDDNIYPEVTWQSHSPVSLTIPFQWYPVHQLSFVIFFVLPVSLLIYFYSNMIIVIRRAGKSNVRRSTVRRLDNQTLGSINDSRRQIVYMLSKPPAYLGLIATDKP